MLRWKRFALLSVSLLVLSCNSKLDVPDVPIKWDAGDEGAIVIYTVSDKEEQVPKDEWDRIRLGHGCLSQKDYGEIRAFIEKLCFGIGGKTRCNETARTMLKDFFSREEKVKKAIEER